MIPRRIGMNRHHQIPLHNSSGHPHHYKSAGALLEHATNAGGRRSSATGNSLVHTALFIVMVRVCENQRSPQFVHDYANLFEDCTYDQPSNRRRNPAPQYIEALENRLQRAEALLRSVLPNVDLNDPNIDVAVQQRRQAGNAKDLAQGVLPKAGATPNPPDQDAHLRSMIESTGQLDLDESGHWDFHGGSSGTVFVRRMREQFGGLLGGEYGTPFLPKLPRPMPPLGPMYDSPRSSMESPHDANLPNTMDLPSREIAKALCADSLNCACSLLRFVHQPTFYEMFERIYDIPPENFGDDENRFLPLLYVTLALGCMFHQDPSEAESGPTQMTYKAGIDQGYVRQRSFKSTFLARCLRNI